MNQAANSAAVADQTTAYDELQSVHQLPHKPCHYVFALASPDACNTHRANVSGSGLDDATEPSPAIPRSPIDDQVETFGRVQMASQEIQSQPDPAKVAAQRRAAEDAHRASMEEARKQKLLDIQMQRQLEQLQKQGAERLLRKEATTSGLKITTAASALSNSRNSEEDLPQLSHGVLSGFGSPPATPEEGLPPQANEDREL